MQHVMLDHCRSCQVHPPKLCLTNSEELNITDQTNVTIIESSCSLLVHNATDPRTSRLLFASSRTESSLRTPLAAGKADIP